MFKRVICIALVILIPLALFPYHAFAVDPVSSATMANAFAQAVTSYGASQGVSMMFDVPSADGIGEAMHDLWNNCKGDLDTEGLTYIPDYETVSNLVWSTLYKKIGSKLGIFLSDTVVGYLDAFYNWLLSGAENIVEVDNQFYEWVLNQSGSVDPYTVVTVGIFFPLPVSSADYSSTVSSGFHCYTSGSYQVYYSSNSSDVFMCFYGDSNSFYPLALSDSPFTKYQAVVGLNRFVSLNSTGSSAPYYQTDGVVRSPSYVDSTVPLFPDFNSAVAAFLSRYDDESSISLLPYIGDVVPRDVHIPDNTDVNYSPIPFEQALDHNWDDTAYGDGTGALTDAQSEAAEASVSQTMVDARTITNYYTTNPPSAPSEVVLPFLPIQLPSFDFSLSGIWHYVVTWVQSLGSWFTTMFTVWNSLPFAMVVPVYATAVIVIVLGVYKRFFM